MILAKSRPTFQRDHAHRVTLREFFHIGKAARRLDQHRERHFGSPPSPIALQGAAETGSGASEITTTLELRS